MPGLRRQDSGQRDQCRHHSKNRTGTKTPHTAPFPNEGEYTSGVRALGRHVSMIVSAIAWRKIDVDFGLLQSSSNQVSDFRTPASTGAALRPIADGPRRMIIATAEIPAQPDRVFQALTTNEVERWWGHPDYYRQTDWQADLRVCGQWRVTVRFLDGTTNCGSGAFAEIDAPRKIVMTQRFDEHPLLGSREATITYRLEPIDGGTRLTVRDEGLVGGSAAAYGHAEHWERVLGWLAAHFGDGEPSRQHS